MVILVAICINVDAQFSAVSFKSKEFLQFKATKTYALLTGNKDYDDAMAAALKESWKITPFDFVDEKQFKEKIRDENASFILPIVIFTEHFGQEYHFIALINGGKKNLGRYNYTDMLAYAIVNHFGNEPENTDCAPRIRNMVECLVNAMQLVQKNDFKGNPKKIAESLMDYYRSQSYKIKDRTLLFCKESMGKKLDENDITNLYPYKFEFCSQQKINEVIKNKDKNYYYFQPTITLNKAMFVFDPATGEVVYGNDQIMGLNVKKKDIEQLIKAINQK